MSSRNRVIWSDGLFVKPHHFQQQTRFVEAMVNSRVSGIEGHFYGFTSLTLDAELLHMGKIAIIEATGVFPDGTAFSLPQQDMAPAPLAMTRSFAAQDVICLCLPLQSESVAEVQGDDPVDRKVGGRLAVRDTALRDNSVATGQLTNIKVGAVRPVLMSASEDLSSFTTLAVCRISEQASGGALTLDETFLPTMLSVSCSKTLRRFVGEFSDGIRRRAEAISQRIGGPGQNGVADVADFLLLQSLNRIEPLMQHYNRLSTVHPRNLYEILIQISGELSTFMSDNRVAPQFPPYNHDMPDLSFAPVIRALRGLLSETLVPTAMAIPVQQKKHGFMVAPLTDPEIIEEREFVLAVRANTSLARLQKDFPAQTKVSSIESIRELVNRQLSGVTLAPLPVAPRQLPYHAGFAYFQLDKQSPHWSALRGAMGFAFHVAGDFPELEVQFWAIRK